MSNNNLYIYEHIFQTTGKNHESLPYRIMTICTVYGPKGNLLEVMGFISTAFSCQIGERTRRDKV